MDGVAIGGRAPIDWTDGHQTTHRSTSYGKMLRNLQVPFFSESVTIRARSLAFPVGMACARRGRVDVVGVFSRPLDRLRASIGLYSLPM